MGLSRFMNCRQELDPLIDTETELMLMETNLETSLSTRGGFINRSKTVVFSKDEIQITHSSSHNKNMFIRNGCIIYNGRRYTERTCPQGTFDENVSVTYVQGYVRNKEKERYGLRPLLILMVLIVDYNSILYSHYQNHSLKALRCNENR